MFKFLLRLLANNKAPIFIVLIRVLSHLKVGIVNDGGQALYVFCPRTNEKGSHLGLPLQNQIRSRKAWGVGESIPPPQPQALSFIRDRGGGVCQASR